MHVGKSRIGFDGDNVPSFGPEKRSNGKPVGARRADFDAGAGGLPGEKSTKDNLVDMTLGTTARIWLGLQKFLDFLGRFAQDERPGEC